MIPSIPPEIPSAWRLSAGVEIAAAGAFAPKLAPGSALFVEASLTDPRAFAFAPSVRFAGIRADSGLLGSSPIVTRFQLQLARAEVWPMRLALLDSVTIAPCASFDVGVLLAEGWASARSGMSQRLWAAPGFGGRFRWTIAGKIELQFDASGWFPLVRDTFVVAPGTIVHAIPGGAGWMDLRAVFVLFKLEEISSAEIADVLALPIGTVASRRSRAREEFPISPERRIKP